MGPINIRIENIGAVKSSDVQFNTRVFDNPNISSATADQLAAANKQSSNPFAVSYLTFVYIEYPIIFGIPAAVAATVIMACHYRYRGWIVRSLIFLESVQLFVRSRMNGYGLAYLSDQD